MTTEPQQTISDDPGAANRKKDHIEMAFRSRVESGELDGRFFYEPMLAAHPAPGSLAPFSFLGKTLRAPIWVSSMTGGTALAGRINHHLARACAEFGMGMGLGSCRQLLYSDEHFADFDVRETMGAELPLFANLGVAQVERLLEQNEGERIPRLLQKLRADGLIVHVNPLQEAMQPEGDVFKRPPVEVVQELLQTFDFQIIVKEVGQGFGPASLKALLQLPLAAIEFAAAGGTNFAKLELLRSDAAKQGVFEKIAAVGHTAEEMLGWTNDLKTELGERCLSQNLILSGGISDFMDGYFLTKKSTFPAVYGQASGFLRHAQGEYAELRTFVQSQVRGLELAGAFLRVR
ncbi:MAG: isopentenyl-diphosphate delta-isomerase [Saprospiraceae bacterium]